MTPRRAARIAGIAMLGAVPLLAFAGYYQYVLNPSVIEEIRTEPGGPRARETLVLTLPGGPALPVNYLHENDRVYIGADGRWWRRLDAAGSAVSIFMRGRDLVGTAHPVNDARLRDAVFARLRPTEPDWLPDWARGKLVVIELESTAPSP